MTTYDQTNCQELFLTSTHKSSLNKLKLDKKRCRLKQVADGSGEYAVGEIGVIGTRPGYQKRGLGRVLLLSGMQRLKEHGGKSIFLETEDGGTAALHLFKSAGFHIVSAWRWFTKEV